MEEQLLPTVEETQPEVVEATEEAEAGEEPTKSVKNFWERLDEVFNLSKQTNQNLEQILEQFPEVQQINQTFQSALFQPERISLCSNDDVQPSAFLPDASGSFIPLAPNVGHAPSEVFSNFRIRLTRPLRNVKSMQLLSAVIPNATTNIPDDQTFFWWYKLRKVGDGITIDATTANQGPWNALTIYTPGDIVSYGGGNWVAQLLSQNDIPAIYWQSLPIYPADSIPTWNSSTAYVVGNIIQYNGKVYECLVNNTNQSPFTPKWVSTTLPTDVTRPNYYDLNIYHLYYVFLSPTWFYPPTLVAAGNERYFNKTFEDYQDIVDSLNFCLGQVAGNNNLNPANLNDISFTYDATLNKIIFTPDPAQIALGYYYLPCGYNDPNISIYMLRPTISVNIQDRINFLGIGALAPGKFPSVPQSILNTRLGFTWNGVFPDPFSLSNPWASLSLVNTLYYYLRQTDPYFAAPQRFVRIGVIGNNYPDLVNTSCVRIYTDFTFGSTQDSLGSSNPAGIPESQGLLSIVPIATNNLGVAFYQNNFNNELTKIPKNITEIGITMLTDQGLPFYLPNSAVVLLELGITYH